MMGEENFLCLEVTAGYGFFREPKFVGQIDGLYTMSICSMGRGTTNEIPLSVFEHLIAKVKSRRGLIYKQPIFQQT